MVEIVLKNYNTDKLQLLLTNVSIVEEHFIDNVSDFLFLVLEFQWFPVFVYSGRQFGFVALGCQCTHFPHHAASIARKSILQMLLLRRRSA